MALHRCSLVCLLLAPLAAQDLKWDLPVGGLATYRATESHEDLSGADKRTALPGASLPHATVLLASELADARTHCGSDLQDLRWIAPYVAFDLRLGKPGKVAFTLPRVPELGDLEFTGTTTGLGADGNQGFELTFQCKPIAPAGDDKADKARVDRWQQMFAGKGGGTLQLQRTFDRARGVVTGFRSELRFDVPFGPRQGNRRGNFALRQQWTLDEVKGHRAPDFEPRVAEAIRNGAARIKQQIDNPDAANFATTHDPNTHSYGEGHLALALLTLLAAGESPHDPVMQRAFDSLRKRDITQTYCLAVAIYAIEKLYAPPRERDDLLAGILKAPVPRKPSPEDQKLLQQWTDRLLTNRDSSVDTGYRSRFWYTGGGNFDNSNSQYAMLGLHSAQLCGIKVSRTVWNGASEHWLESQHAPSGKPRGLQLLGHKEAAGKDLATMTRAGTVRRIEPRGWSYQRPGPNVDAYGSMTCAGIASLSLCAAALDDGKARRTPLESRIDDALRSGFCWLSANRTVRWNAGPPDHRTSWYHYWMYSLERACELSRVMLIDGWDWYHDGAQVLMATQASNGAFDNASLDDQCFAVLFLKKAQLPALTGPR